MTQSSPEDRMERTRQRRAAIARREAYRAQLPDLPEVSYYVRNEDGTLDGPFLTDPDEEVTQ